MIPTDYLELLKKEYPQRMGHQNWEKVRTLAPRLCSMWGIPWETLLKGARNYKAMLTQQGKVGSEFVMPAGKFFDDRDQLFAEYADMDMRTPVQIAVDARWTRLAEAAEKAGFVLPDRANGIEYAEAKMRDFQSEASRGLGAPKFAVVR